MRLNNLRDQFDEEVDHLLGYVAGRDADNVDCVEGRAQTRVRLESTCVDRVRNSKANIRIHLDAQREVLFARVTDAYRCIDVGEGPLQNLVKVNACCIIVQKVNMLGDHCLYSKRLGQNDTHVHGDARAEVTVDHIYVLARQDLPN